MKLRLKKRLFTVTPLKLFLLIILLTIALVIYIAQTGFLNVKKISVSSDNLSCVQNSQIKTTLDFLGKNILFLNLEKAKDVLKSKYLCVKEIAVSRLLPDKLEIQVIQRKAEILLSPLKLRESSNSAIEELINLPATQSAQILQSNEEFLIDNQGVIFEKGVGENIFKVYLSQDLSVGKKLDESLIKNLLKIFQKSKDFGLNIDKGYLEKNDLIIIDMTPKLVFRINPEIDDQLAALQLILENAKIGDKEIEFIDLRFDKPVVRYGQR